MGSRAQQQQQRGPTPSENSSILTVPLMVPRQRPCFYGARYFILDTSIKLEAQQDVAVSCELYFLVRCSVVLHFAAFAAPLAMHLKNNEIMQCMAMALFFPLVRVHVHVCHACICPGTNCTAACLLIPLPIARVTVIEAKELLGTFDGSLREYAARKLVAQGVKLRRVRACVRQLPALSLSLLLGRYQPPCGVPHSL